MLVPRLQAPLAVSAPGSALALHIAQSVRTRQRVVQRPSSPSVQGSAKQSRRPRHTWSYTMWSQAGVELLEARARPHVSTRPQQPHTTTHTAHARAGRAKSNARSCVAGTEGTGTAAAPCSRAGGVGGGSTRGPQACRR
eukprot:2302312-Rhodomonas_salina.1